MLSQEKLQMLYDLFEDLLYIDDEILKPFKIIYKNSIFLLYYDNIFILKLISEIQISNKMPNGELIHVIKINPILKGYSVDIDVIDSRLNEIIDNIKKKLVESNIIIQI